MTFCASCGLQLSGDRELCPHHGCTYPDDWAASNRILCDFFHRGKPLPRPVPARDDYEVMLP